MPLLVGKQLKYPQHGVQRQEGEMLFVHLLNNKIGS